jgi:hypothetical protein
MSLCHGQCIFCNGQGLPRTFRRQPPILGVELAHRESPSSWRDFLRGLKARGLNGVELVVSDDHAGLKPAIREVLPEAVWQRCYVHFLRNALDYVPRKVDDDSAPPPPMAEGLPEPAPTVVSLSIHDEQPVQQSKVVKRSSGKAPKGKTQSANDVIPISLRPSRDLYRRCVMAATERSREEGRVISIQEIMLEILDVALKGQK